MRGRGFTTADWTVLVFAFALAIAAVLHIAFGLPKLFSALSDPAAPGWVQAIGSIGAIGIAIYISHDGERSARSRAYSAMMQFASMAVERIGGVYVVTDSSPEAFRALYVERFCVELEEVQLIGRQIDVGLLDEAVAPLVLELRVLISRSIALSTKVSAGRVEHLHRWQEEISTTQRMLKNTWDRAKEIQVALQN